MVIMRLSALTSCDGPKSSNYLEIFYQLHHWQKMGLCLAKVGGLYFSRYKVFDFKLINCISSWSQVIIRYQDFPWGQQKLFELQAQFSKSGLYIWQSIPAIWFFYEKMTNFWLAVFNFLLFYRLFHNHLYFVRVSSL